MFYDEREKLEKEYQARGLPHDIIQKELENHDKYTFFIPYEARWEKVKHIKTNVGSSNEYLFLLELLHLL